MSCRVISGCRRSFSYFCGDTTRKKHDDCGVTVEDLLPLTVRMRLQTPEAVGSLRLFFGNGAQFGLVQVSRNAS